MHRTACSACRRHASAWASMKKKGPETSSPSSSSSSSSSAPSTAWRPPPKAAQPVHPEMHEESSLEAMPGNELTFSPTPPDMPTPFDRMSVRKGDLPWPYIETSKSVQIIETQAQQGVIIWTPPKDQDDIREEESLIQTDFCWENDVNPVESMMRDAEGNMLERTPTVDYESAYRFEEGNKLVERYAFFDIIGDPTNRHPSPFFYHLTYLVAPFQPRFLLPKILTNNRTIRRKDNVAYGALRPSTTENVTFRTRERIPRDGVAYFESNVSASCLHFGFGITETTAFHPRRWVGYERGSWGHYEDGRIGTLNDERRGRVVKVRDDVGVLVYSPPEEDIARILFFKNEEPSGEVIEIPKSDAGWYFSFTLIGYHYGGAHARITSNPAMVDTALMWLGREMHPEDEDFQARAEGEVFDSAVTQPFCKNRHNPYHLCSHFCREPAPSTTPTVVEGHTGKLSENDELPFRPGYLKGEGQNSSAKDNRGKWKFSFISGHRNFQTNGMDPNRRWRAKYSNHTPRTHLTGNMASRK